MTTRWRRTVAAIVTVLVMALVVPVSAYAAVLATAKASQSFSALSWKAVPVAAGGSAGSGSLSLPFVRSNDKTSRQAVFDIVNTGTSTLSGVTLTASGSSGIASNRNVSLSYCSAAWTMSSSNGITTYSCQGSKSLGNTSNGGNGTVTITQSIAAGARLYIRASTTASANNSSVSQTISITVTRSQAAAKRTR